MNVTARTAIDISNTTEKTVNFNETNPVPVEETEPAENAAMCVFVSIIIQKVILATSSCIIAQVGRLLILPQQPVSYP